jgi:hypothetical protein
MKIHDLFHSYDTWYVETTPPGGRHTDVKSFFVNKMSTLMTNGSFWTIYNLYSGWSSCNLPDSGFVQTDMPFLVSFKDYEHLLIHLLITFLLF